MNRFDSERSITKFYGAIFFVAFFTIGFGASIMAIAITQWHSIDPNEKESYFSIVFSFVYYLIAIFYVYKYFENVPKISISDTGINFNNVIVFWHDIERIDSNTLRRFNCITWFKMSATVITLKNGQEKIIYNEMYSNIKKMHSVIKKIMPVDI